MNFDFASPQRVLFGPGTFQQAGALAQALGRRALVVTGRDPTRAAPLLDLLRAAGIATEAFPVGGEPTTDVVRAGTARALAIAADLVVGFGGGSPLDAAKAIAVLATNGGDPLDYLEVVGRGHTLSQASLPVLAIPTTAGTGSEVTRNAVLASPEHQVKASLRNVTMIPRVAIVDPELTYGVPPAVTASTGLDALTQLIEPFTCNRTNPLVDGFCRDGIARAARSLRRAWANGRDAAARADMALASLYGGFSLANAGLGVVHGFAGVVGGAFAAPHGAVCAAILPHAMAVNRAALLAREPASPTLARYDEIARLLTGRADAQAADGVAWVRELTTALGVPALAAHGVARTDVPALVEKAAVASGTKTNPIQLTNAELAEILERAL
ncbi:MAG: iron-containing alcohol dehydrogenase [Kiritimatiellia bacterium]